MARLPIIERFSPAASPEEIARIDALALELGEKQELSIDPTLEPLAATEWPDAPELHFDDQSDITSKEVRHDNSYLQDRARLRASEGDVVACNRAPAPGYEAYCRDYLGLGAVEWLSPEARRYRRHLASHLWTDRSVRRELIRAIRADGLQTIHPMMGSREAWHLANLLHRASRRPMRVLAPPPRLARWVNDKTAFARTVTELFGEASIPVTRDATSLALASRHVKDIAFEFANVGLKLPDAAGGSGNLVVPARRFRGRSLDVVAKQLKEVLPALGWRSGDRLLVSAWEPDVLAAPSAQLWIPPEPDRAPIVEGLFEQKLEGPGYEFVGTRPAVLPEAVTQLIVTRCWLLASLYQRLGYVGRCSFDLVLTGKTLDESRAELIECNGRWGGTSLPMTLMNRLFGVDAPPYVVHSVTMRGLARLDFPALLEHLSDDLFDIRTNSTGRGRVVFFDPARMQACSGLSYIAIGDSDEDATSAAEHVPRRLQELLRWRRSRTKVGLP